MGLARRKHTELKTSILPTLLNCKHQFQKKKDVPTGFNFKSHSCMNEALNLQPVPKHPQVIPLVTGKSNPGNRPNEHVATRLLWFDHITQNTLHHYPEILPNSWALLEVHVFGLSRREHWRDFCARGNVAAGHLRDASSFGHVSFVIGYFPDFSPKKHSCLMASSAGTVGYFPTLQYN